MPPINQIRWAPGLYDAGLVASLHERGVVLEGWSPFKSSDLRDPVLTSIAERHGATAAQVVIRWHLQHGFVAIPKSSNRDRIAENLDVLGFSLDAEEMRRIDGLGG